jgi:hypothetical protein
MQRCSSVKQHKEGCCISLSLPSDLYPPTQGGRGEKMAENSVLAHGAH